MWKSQLPVGDNTCSYNRYFVNVLGALNILTVENTILPGGSSDCIPQDLRQNCGPGTSSGYRVLSAKDWLVLYGQWPHHTEHWKGKKVLLGLSECTKALLKQAVAKEMEDKYLSVQKWLGLVVRENHSDDWVLPCFGALPSPGFF